MNAYSLAAQMLGDTPLTQLTPGQLAQLRAIDRNYQQRVYTLRHAVGDVAEQRGTRAGSAVPAERDLTAAEEADLRARVVADVLAMLTPAQRSAVERS